MCFGCFCCFYGSFGWMLVQCGFRIEFFIVFKWVVFRVVIVVCRFVCCVGVLGNVYGLDCCFFFDSQLVYFDVFVCVEVRFGVLSF